MYHLPAHTFIYFVVLCKTCDILVYVSFWTDIMAIWAWQAAPGWSVSWGDCREEASSQGWKPQACSGDSAAAQGRSNLIPKEVCWWTVCILYIYWYILVCPILTTVSLNLRLYCVVFILGRTMCCSMHWIGIIQCRNIIKLCPNCAHVWKKIWSQITVYTWMYHIWLYVFIIYWYMHKYEVYPSL